MSIKYGKGGMYFPLPVEIFRLGLSTGAIAVYAYLMCCEDRKTYQCRPSYRAIGRAVSKSKNSVHNYLYELVDRDLIQMEQTKVVTKKGVTRNGTMLITILPIWKVVEAQHEKELEQLKVLERKREVEKRTQGEIHLNFVG